MEEELPLLLKDCPLSFSWDEFFYITDCVNYWLIRTKDIICLESDGNYTKVWIQQAKKNLFIRRPLYKCEEKLTPKIFFRANRHYIINLGHVKKIATQDEKRLYVEMTNGAYIIFSRDRSVIFRRTKSF